MCLSGEVYRMVFSMFNTICEMIETLLIVDCARLTLYAVWSLYMPVQKRLSYCVNVFILLGYLQLIYRYIDK